MNGDARNREREKLYDVWSLGCEKPRLCSTSDSMMIVVSHLSEATVQ
jgi:hypothetical protein